MKICGPSIHDRDDSKCKGPEVETYLVFEELRECHCSQSIMFRVTMRLHGYCVPLKDMLRS